MKRHLTSLILTAALSTIVGSTVSAQSQSAVIADVPFTFQVHNVSFAAGRYSVSWEAPSGLMTLTNSSGSPRIFATYPNQVSTAEEPKLTFVCYGPNCELSKVSLPGFLECGLPKSSNVENVPRRVGLAAEVRSVRLTTR